MQKIIIIATGEVQEVTNNVAFGLIDSGKAKLYKSYQSKPYLPTSNMESNRLPIRSRKEKKGYKTK